MSSDASRYDLPPRAAVTTVTLHATEAPHVMVHVIEGRTDEGAVSMIIHEGLHSIAIHVPRRPAELELFAIALREAAEKFRSEAENLRAAELPALLTLVGDEAQ